MCVYVCMVCVRTADSMTNVLFFVSFSLSLSLFPCAAVLEKVQLIGKIRESLENVYGPEYGAFLKEFVPVFMRILQNVPRQTVLNAEHKLRNMILEVSQ